jgi:hypothetical protein
MVESRVSSRFGPSGALCMGFDKLLYHSEMRGTAIKVRKKANRVARHTRKPQADPRNDPLARSTPTVFPGGKYIALWMGQRETGG